MTDFAAELRHAAENGDNSYISQLVGRLEESLCNDQAYKCFFGLSSNGHIRQIAREKVFRALFPQESFENIERVKGELARQGKDPVGCMVDYILKDEVCGNKACTIGPECEGCKPNPLNEDCDHYYKVPREVACYIPG